MATPIHTVTCTKNERIARDIYECRFTKPEDFDFHPGQFVLFQVPLIEDEADIQTRAFSIGSSPNEDELIFAMKLVEGGRASRWIAERLEKGMQASMMGPFGVFTLDRETDKDYLFVCTSTGVAPFRSQLLTILPEGDSRRIDLVYGVRSEEDLFWHEELQELAKQYENFYVHLALSDPTGDWKGHKGRVQTLTTLIAPDLSSKKVYICGNPTMAKEVKELCLNEWGCTKEHVHMEGYI